MSKMSILRKIVLTIQLVFLCVVLIEIELPVKKFLLATLQKHQNMLLLQESKAYRILCLGDSMTAFGGDYSYPRQLQRLLNQKSEGRGFSVINGGVSGIKSTHIVTNLEENIDKYNPDIVIVMIGENDDYWGGGRAGTDDGKFIHFVKKFRVYKLVKRFFRKRKDARLLRLLSEVTENGSIFSEPGKILSGDSGEKIESLDVYSNLMECSYHSAGYNLSKEMLSDIIELNLDSRDTYLLLGQYYNECLGNYGESENMLRKVLKLNPKKYNAYIWLGKSYFSQGKYGESEKILKKAVEVNPERYEAYDALGDYYWTLERLDKTLEISMSNHDVSERSIEMYKMATEVNLGKCLDLAEYDRSLDDFVWDETLIRRAIEINSTDSEDYIEVGKYYGYEGRFDEAKEILKKEMKMSLTNEVEYYLLKSFNVERGKKWFDGKSFSTREGYYNLLTSYNYRQIKNILTQRNIQLIVVQYPMRSSMFLRGMFNNDDNIVIIDNEGIFKRAVKSGSYEEYFRDSYGGNFGHCTPKGNRLLAENIVNTMSEKLMLE